jgi:hypothetical protein
MECPAVLAPVPVEADLVAPVAEVVQAVEADLEVAAEEEVVVEVDLEAEVEAEAAAVQVDPASGAQGWAQEAAIFPHSSGTEAGGASSRSRARLFSRFAIQPLTRGLFR